MANTALGFPNWVAGSTVATPAIIAAGSWESALPAANVLDAALAKVARSTDATTASTVLAIDLGAARNVRLAAVPASNVSTAGRIKVTGYSDSGLTTEVVTTGWVDYWADAYAWGARPWGSPDLFSPKLSAEDAAGYPATWSYLFDADVIARYWQIEIDDTGNADGYIDVARVVLAPAWQGTLGAAIGGTSLAWQTRSRVLRSRAGVVNVDVRPPQRVASVAFRAVAINEAFANPFEMARRQGLDGEVFLATDPDDTVHALRRSFLARLSALPTLTYADGERFDFTLELEEII